MPVGFAVLFSCVCAGSAGLEAGPEVRHARLSNLRPAVLCQGEENVQQRFLGGCQGSTTLLQQPHHTCMHATWL